MQMKVYDYPGFPNPERVRIAAAEKGVLGNIEFITIDIPSGEGRKPEFLAKSPLGTVPLLELNDGTCISECTAISEYLDGLRGTPTLTGVVPRDRAVIHMMQRRSEALIVDAIGAYFHHATPGFGPLIETNQIPAWGEAGLQRTLLGMRYFDKILSKQSYLNATSFSMADISLFTGIEFAQTLKIAIPKACAALVEYCERLKERPSFAARISRAGSDTGLGWRGNQAEKPL